MSTIYSERVIAVRKKLGLTQADFADKLGFSKNYISELERGAKIPGGDFLVALVLVFNINLHYLKNGDGTIFNDGNAYGNDIFNIPEYEGQAKYLPFDKKYLERELRIIAEKFEHIFYYTITCDLMVPTLNEGDVVLIDTSVKTVEDEGAFIVKIGEKVLPRRITFLPNGDIQLTCDNATLKEFSVICKEEDVNIVGEICWFGRKI